MRTLTGIVVLCAAAGLTLVVSWLLWPAEQPSQAAPAAAGRLKVETNPPATIVTIDGEPWPTPPEIPAGEHTVRLAAPGYAPVQYRLSVATGQVVTLRGVLEDLTPPTVALAARPTLPVEGEVVTAVLDLADDGSGLVRLEFQVDGELLHTETIDGLDADHLEMQIAALAPGLHRLTAVVTDAGGNSNSRELYVDVQPRGYPAPPLDIAALELPPPGETLAAPSKVADVAESSLIPTDGVVTDLSEGGEPGINSGPVVSTPPPPITRATLYTETIIIPTYGYTEALDTSGPRPRLVTERMTPPQPAAYTAIILENDALRLAVLPALGGRLYQITDKATGEKLLYTNPVIKPTHWGPPEMNWWLAVGGMEWAYPVAEHGYAWADAWAYSSDDNAEGLTLTLNHTDAPTGLQAQVRLFLPAQGRYFTVAPAVTNTGAAPALAQLWLNAAFRAGPTQRLTLPAAQVRVHSAGEPEGVQPGQILPWQPELAGWGRWQTWFSAFAAPAVDGVLTVSSDGVTPVLQRSFNPAETPGVKWFTWGPNGPAGEWAGQPYFEVWGGLTPDFDTYLNLPPGETRGWQEMWSVIDAN
ncbi:MAG: hypothetical protein FOGNACKC_05508 [Anaerolineae bacterium]|nr:hypothetical protein [Anaerolineae bacterium]